MFSMIGRDEDGLCDLFITNAKGLCSPHSMEASSGLVTEGAHAALSPPPSLSLFFSSSYTQLVSTPHKRAEYPVCIRFFIFFFGSHMDT